METGNSLERTSSSAGPPPGNKHPKHRKTIIIRNLCGAHWVLMGSLLAPIGDYKPKLIAFGINLLAIMIAYIINHLQDLNMIGNDND